MNLLVTGGGTGGHVYPALEVAIAAREQGWSVSYYGSERGQEGGACKEARIPIRKFGSEPLVRPFSLRGARAILRFLVASSRAGKAMREDRPNVVFSTGGFAAAPVVNAAKRNRIPLVIHEQNSVPGRANLMAANHAYAVCTVFHKAAEHFPAAKVRRTGMPVRAAIRSAAQQASPPMDEPMVLVVGGSQGSAALNDAALGAAVRMIEDDIRWVHVTGIAHFESTMRSLGKLASHAHYSVKAHLSGADMAQALADCSVALCRSGSGTITELAAFRRPSILVPYPHAFADHQRHNALEIQELGGGDLVDQATLEPALVEEKVHHWLRDSVARARAERALADWDVPDSTERILTALDEAAQARG